MREETRRKLERQLWLERAKKIGMGVAVLAIIGALFVYKDYDSHIDKEPVPGTIVAVGPLNTNSTKMVENGLSVDVKLDTGRLVNVYVLKTTHPYVGEHVNIMAHRHHTGRTTYSWK